VREPLAEGQEALVGVARERREAAVADRHPRPRGWRLSIILATVFMAAVGTPPSSWAATEITVLATPAGEFQPARGPDLLAWERNTRTRPNHYDVFLRRDGGSPVRANTRRTSAAMGDITGDRLLYQEYRGERSTLRFFSMQTGGRTNVPGVNSRHWEYWPSVSGQWVLFGRWNRRNDARNLFLHNLETGERRKLDRTKSEKAFIGPGQVNGQYAVWSKCLPNIRCDVYRYDIAGGGTEVLPNPGYYQRAPSVTPDGTVYFSRGGKGCGQSVQLVRQGLTGPSAVILQLQKVLDIRDTYAFVDEFGRVEVYYERNACGRPAAADLFKIVDLEIAGLSLNLAGTGTGTVTSSPSGISCEADCSEQYTVGTEVTLTATAGRHSLFTGWSGACVGMGPCVVSLDGPRSVTATFSSAFGSITIRKEATPDHSTDFEFATSPNLGGANFFLDDDPASPLPNTRTYPSLPAGTYSVEEVDVPPGWLLTGLTCTGGGPDTVSGGRLASIGLDPGEDVDCTFSNTEAGTIVVTKNAEPDGKADFTFSSTGGLSPATFQLDDDEGLGNPSALPDTMTFSDVLPGNFTITEDPPPIGWLLSSLACQDPDDGSDTDVLTRSATIDLDAGEVVTCTFTNTEVADP
jgi:hypothetical protein